MMFVSRLFNVCRVMGTRNIVLIDFLNVARTTCDVLVASGLSYLEAKETLSAICLHAFEPEFIKKSFTASGKAEDGE